MCIECSGHVGQSDCPVCSEDDNITPINKLERCDVISCTKTNGELSEATVWRDGKEDVVDFEALNIHVHLRRANTMTKCGFQ